MENKKVFWCISKYASPPQYGVGARLFYISKEFSTMDIDVILFSSDSNHLSNYPPTKKIYNYEYYDSLLHIWIKTHKYKRSASFHRIVSWVDFEWKLFMFKNKLIKKPSVVIISSLSLLTIIYGIYLKSIYKCKLVFEIRDIYPMTLLEEFGVSKWHPMVLLLGFLEKIGYEKSDLIVGTMPNLKDHIKNVIKEDKDVFYSPIGIHEIWSNELLRNISIDYLFPKEKKFIVGYAGSMGVSNALESLIEAIIKMSDNNDIHFVIIGDGDLKEKYSEKLSGLSNVTIGPKISQKEIPAFLRRCDLLYLSTRKSKIWDYGQSMNKMIDYMMAGKPIVASYSGYPSMLNEANSGVFVQSDDVDSIITSILSFKEMNSSERMLYGQRGKLWVEENHNYKKIAEKYYIKIIELFNHD